MFTVRSFLPPFGCTESPDSRLKSSRAEVAEVGAEEAEEAALPGAAGGPEMRDPRRESSAVRGSGTGGEKPNQRLPQEWDLVNKTSKFSL